MTSNEPLRDGCGPPPLLPTTSTKRTSIVCLRSPQRPPCIPYPRCLIHAYSSHSHSQLATLQQPGHPLDVSSITVVHHAHSRYQFLTQPTQPARTSRRRRRHRVSLLRLHAKVVQPAQLTTKKERRVPGPSFLVLSPSCTSHIPLRSACCHVFYP